MVGLPEMGAIRNASLNEWNSNTKHLNPIATIKTNSMNTDTKNLYEACQVKLSYVNETKISDRTVIRNADDAAKFLFASWDRSTIEHFETVKILLLNRAHQVLGVAIISQGGLSGSVIDIRIVAQYALTANASSVILAHNHPSGNRSPSIADIQITEKVKNAMQLLDIQLLDHLILNKDGEYGRVE